MDPNSQQSSSSQPRRSRRLQQLGTGKGTSGRRTQQKKPQAESLSSTAIETSEENTEEVSEDDVCPICSLLLYRPVTTRCNHTMCEVCMAHWADVSLSQHMTIVDVDEEPVAFDPVSELQASCPLCRTPTTASFNPEMARRLQTSYPKKWAELKQENEEDGEGMGGIQTITVYIGNRHHLVQTEKEHEDGRSNQHEWTFFVQPSRTDIIEEIQILLHPTFKPNKVIRQRAPYEISRLGWGTFTLTAYVILKAGYSWVSSEAENTPDGAAKGMLQLSWLLDFEGYNGRGSKGRTKLKVKSDREWEGEDGEGARDDAEWQRTVRQYQRDGRFEMEE